MDIILQSKSTRYLRLSVHKMCSVCYCLLPALELFIPILDYGCCISAAETNLLPLNIDYNSVCKFVLGGPFITHYFINV